MNLDESDSEDRSSFNTQVIVGVAAGVVVIIVGIAVYLARSQPEPIPDPGGPLEAVQPAETAEERGDTAREIIDRLKASGESADYVEAHSRAQQFHADGRLADAQLLYFFAARGGYAPAAFSLASANDPNQDSAAVRVVATPDPFQAYRWYTTARDAGHDEAAGRLAALREWAESAGSAGDYKAEQLLLQWEQTP